MPPDQKLRRLFADGEANVTVMASWSWERTARHLDLIDEQLRWACEQENEVAIARLEEFRRQVVAARCRKFDTET